MKTYVYKTRVANQDKLMKDLEAIAPGKTRLIVKPGYIVVRAHDTVDEASVKRAVEAA
jgi:hypothetical protein